MNKVVRTGIVGMGGRGFYFAELFGKQSHPGFDLRAVCDLNPECLRKAREVFGENVAGYSDLAAMLRDPAVDAVLVTTNDPYHVEPTLAALAAGKHVLVEKPLCQSIEDALRIVAAVSKAKGVFKIGFELRCCTVFQRMRELLNEGRIGEVKIGHAFDNVSVGGQYFFHNPKHQKSFYKTLLLQKASHSLDLLNWFMDSDPVKVYGIGGQDFYGRKEDNTLRCHKCARAPKCPYRVGGDLQMDYNAVVSIDDYCVWGKQMDLNDNAELCVSYANGGKATFHECHFTPEYSREFWLVGTQGKMYGYYDNEGRFRIRIEHSYSEERFVEEYQPPHTGGGHGGGDNRMRDEFYNQIIANIPNVRSNLESLRSGYNSTALAVAAHASIESGLPVEIPCWADLVKCSMGRA